MRLVGERLVLRLGEALRMLREVGAATAAGLRMGLLRLLRLLVDLVDLRLPLLREVGEATAAGLRILRVLLRTGLLRLPFLAARTLAIIALAAAEPLAGRPLRRGEVLLRLLLESEVGESNLTILLMQIKKIIFFYFCSDFITFFF